MRERQRDRGSDRERKRERGGRDKLGVSGYGTFIARIFDSVAFKACLFLNISTIKVF